MCAGQLVLSFGLTISSWVGLRELHCVHHRLCKTQAFFIDSGIHIAITTYGAPLLSTYYNYFIILIIIIKLTNLLSRTGGWSLVGLLPSASGARTPALRCANPRSLSMESVYLGLLTFTKVVPHGNLYLPRRLHLLHGHRSRQHLCSTPPRAQLRNLISRFRESFALPVPVRSRNTAL